ncbi:hypothetical protein ACHAL6_00710 [Proteiniclasticum sp. C24MP]|uniref:hypothetical protein n=1 Tax=Proteiniclasticum sp. C24MP TaxID=3374101 RepID=UPI003755393D
MEITVKIEAPGIMEALLAIAEQMQTHNALLAGKPAPTGSITVGKLEKAIEMTVKEDKPKEVEEAKEEVKETTEDIDVETTRALVMSSKAHKEKAKEVMTQMGERKITDLNQEQLNELYKALQEVK